MAFEVIQTNQNTAQEIHDNDYMVLLAGVSVFSSGDGIFSDGEDSGGTNDGIAANLRVQIMGSISAGDDGLDIFGSLTSVTNLSVFIGAQGSVFGGGGEGIDVQEGSNNRIVNYGTIGSFGANGIYMDEQTDARIENYGAITAANRFGYGVYVDAGNARIINSGTISANDYAVGTSINASFLLVNSGTITSVNSDSFRGGLDEDVVINSGLMNGDVALNNGDDIYRAIGDGAVNGVVLAGAGADFLLGGGLVDALSGEADDDFIRGFGGDDQLLGGDGDDNLGGGDGDDFVVGGFDNDIIRGDDGSDTLIGDDLDDTITGGNDTLIGGNGDDVLEGQVGDDRLVGGNGDDAVNGDAGNDQLFGNNGDDGLFGGTGNDTIRAGLGNDVVRGEEDADTLFGNEGDDTMTGGTGRDLLFGGAGSDTFIFADGDTGIGGPGRDVIRDFEQGLDTIDLAQFAGAFTFAGTGPYTGGGTNSIRLIEGPSGTVVGIDSDGDGTRDSEIFVSGVTGLTADDFAL